MDIIEQYVTSYPSPQNLVDLFGGEWLSRFPPPHDGRTGGTVPLFQDSRINNGPAGASAIRGVRVLELGPSKGGTATLSSRVRPA